MGIYGRKDSPFWWMLIEGVNVRASTGVPRHGGSPTQDRELQRQAAEIYAARKTEYAKEAAGLVTVRPAIRFSEYAKWYETHVASHHRGYTHDRSILRQLVTAFGDRPLAAVDVYATREWMTARLRTGLKPATINRELDVLKAMLNGAVPKYLDRPPLSEIRRLRVVEAERRILSREEERRLLEVADDEARALLIVAIDTLLRLSSVVHLRWAQVKTDRDLIVPLNAKVSHDYVPITGRAKAALAALSHDGPWVFAGLHRKGLGKTAAKNKAIRRFDQLCQQAGVPYGRMADGVTFHCLRHTGATRALQAGASVRTVMKLGGWKDIRSVLRYTHAADIDVRLAAESIGRPITSPALEPDLPQNVEEFQK